MGSVVPGVAARICCVPKRLKSLPDRTVSNTTRRMNQIRFLARLKLNTHTRTLLEQSFISAMPEAKPEASLKAR